MLLVLLAMKIYVAPDGTVLVVGELLRIEVINVGSGSFLGRVLVLMEILVEVLWMGGGSLVIVMMVVAPGPAGFQT